MSRVKTFDATGIAPNGKLYAGDLNAMQDQYADLLNYSQNVAVGTLAVGEASLQLVRYGTLEARMTGAMRVDGILRGLGGLFGGQFTTAQRDAIPAGSRPYGLLILNTTLNIYQWNKGTDAVPVWASLMPDVFPVGYARPIFSEPPSLTGVVEIPSASGWLLCNGAAVLEADYPDLFTLIGGAYGVPAAGQFNLPDTRGRDLFGRAAGVPFTVLGAAGGMVEVALTIADMPVHTHVQNAHNHVQNAHGHNHNHLLRDAAGTGALTREKNDFAAGGSVLGVVRGGVNPIVQADFDNTPATATNQDTVATNQNAGGGDTHENMPPHLVIGGWVIKAKMV
jgi:microcystin-dependent protein